MDRSCPSVHARWIRTALLPMALLGACLLGPGLQAAPYTHHFDELILLVGARAGELAGNPDRAARKLEKGLQKIRSSLADKVSTSLITDLKNAGKVARGLRKLLPAELATPGSPLANALAAAMSGLRADVLAAVDAAQDALNRVGPSSCKEKALALLAKVHALRAAADAAGSDVPTAAKLLGSANKSTLKVIARTGSAKCSVPPGGNGNGNGDGNGNGNGNNSEEYFLADLSGAVDGKFTALGILQTDATYDSFVDQINVFGTDPTRIMNLLVAVRGVTGPGTYPALSGSSFGDVTKGIAYGIQVTGSVTFTVVDFQKPELVGTFEVTMKQAVPAGDAVVTASNGRFRVLNLPGRN